MASISSSDALSKKTTSLAYSSDVLKKNFDNYANMLGKVVYLEDIDEKDFNDEEIQNGMLVIIKRSDGTNSWAILQAITRNIFEEKQYHLAVFLDFDKCGSKTVGREMLIKPKDFIKLQIEKCEDDRSKKPKLVESEIPLLKKTIYYL